MRTDPKQGKLVSNRTDSSALERKKVEAARRGPSLFPTYLARSKGLCSQGKSNAEVITNLQFSSVIIFFSVLISAELSLRLNQFSWD